jgi:hypothetical protein
MSLPGLLQCSILTMVCHAVNLNQFFSSTVRGTLGATVARGRSISVLASAAIRRSAAALLGAERFVKA